MIDYDKLLDKWAEKLYEKIDWCNNEIEYFNDYDFHAGKVYGYRDGLCEALAYLNMFEKKENRKKDKNNV